MERFAFFNENFSKIPGEGLGQHWSFSFLTQQMPHIQTRQFMAI